MICDTRICFHIIYIWLLIINSYLSVQVTWYVCTYLCTFDKYLHCQYIHTVYFKIIAHWWPGFVMSRLYHHAFPIFTEGCNPLTVSQFLRNTFLCIFQWEIMEHNMLFIRWIMYNQNRILSHLTSKLFIRHIVNNLINSSYQTIINSE